MRKAKALLLLSLGLASAQASAFDVNDFLPCQPLDPKQHYDDYNDPAAKVHLGTVETYHFAPEVEQLIRGESATVAKDLAFVLRQFPNHYRALNAMAKWQLKNRIPDDPLENVWTADCYFQRAIEFRPNDWIVHEIYAVYLHRSHRLQEAERAYQSAEDHGATGADYFYNRGLLEVDLGNLDKAEEYANKAYALGDPLPGLRDKLAKARAKQGGAAAPRSQSARPTANNTG